MHHPSFLYNVLINIVGAPSARYLQSSVIISRDYPRASPATVAPNAIKDSTRFITDEIKRLTKLKTQGLNMQNEVRIRIAGQKRLDIIM